MKPRTKALISFTVLVVLLFGLYAFSSWFSRTTGYFLGEDEKVKLAQCLDGKNTIFYVSSTCPKCDEQKELFGETAMRFIKTIDCVSVEQNGCEGGVPAWKINNNFYYGVHSLKRLIELSGCEVD